jgi:acyl-CoA hydrolase
MQLSDFNYDLPPQLIAQHPLANRTDSRLLEVKAEGGNGALFIDRQFRDILNLIKPGDLNSRGTLFGGRLLAWIDEELALYSIIQLENPKIVTKHMSEINFRSSAKQGDIVEIGIDVVKFGQTSITLTCQVRNMMTRDIIITIDTITMVSLGVDGKPKAHGKTQIEYIKDRLGD